MKASIVACAIAILCGCAPSTFEDLHARGNSVPRLDRALNTALSWPAPSHVDALVGARLVEDGTRVSYPEIAIARAAMRTNPRITAMAALMLAGATARSARLADLPPEFLGATLLQESAFDPHALSAAGAVGIAQFELDTAAEAGVDPFDPFDAIGGASRLLAGYVAQYRGRYADPYAAALAAYNAGPGAVARYRGIPPYRETQEYVFDIYDRWSRIVSYERLPAEFPALGLKARK